MTWRVWIIPAAIVALSFAGVLGAKQISLPTLTYIFDKHFEGRTDTANLTIEGVRCYGTANALRQHIGDLPGLVSMVAYAGRHRIVLEYDPAKTNPNQIALAIERPFMTPQGPIPLFRVLSTQVE
jgi:hypothetical protein